MKNKEVMYSLPLPGFIDCRQGRQPCQWSQTLTAALQQSRRIIVFVGIFGIILSSCRAPERKKTDISQIVIDIDKAEPLVLSEVFDEVTYVPLSDTFLIGEIERAKIYGNRLLLLTNGTVLMYDIATGAPILKIDKQGKGPGEYRGIWDMLSDEKECRIEILDNKRVVRYDMKGDFVSDFNVPFLSYSFHKITDNDYLFYNGNRNFGMSETGRHMLMRYDPERDSATNRYFPVDEHMATYYYIYGENNFTGSPVSFNYSPSDTVYGFSESGVPYPRYTVNFASHHIPTSFYREAYADIRDFSEKASTRSYISGFNYATAGGDVCFTFRHDRHVYWALHDKKSEQTRIARTLTDERLIDGEIEIGYENGPVMMDDNRMYFFLQAAQLAEMAENSREGGESPVKDNRLVELYHSPSFSEEANQILVVCKFKGE